MQIFFKKMQRFSFFEYTDAETVLRDHSFRFGLYSTSLKTFLICLQFVNI